MVMVIMMTGIKFIKKYDLFSEELFIEEINLFPIFNINGKEKVSGIFSGYDIETTSLTKDKKSLSYIQMVGVGSQTLYFRNIEESVNFLLYCSKLVNKIKNVKMLCLIHFESFEWQFIKNYLPKSQQIFARKKHDIIECKTDTIIFRCTYALTRLPLKRVGEIYCNNAAKQSGEIFDYHKIRTPITRLNFFQYKYCFYDIEILRQFHKNYIYPVYLTSGYLPLTQTGMVRNTYRKALRKWCMNNGKKVNDYKYYLYDLQLSEKLYDIARKAFRGAIVFANQNYVGDEVYIDSYDIGSSYPYCMLCDDYPVTPFMNSTFTWEKLEKYCCLITIKLYNVVSKSDFFHPISISNLDEYYKDAVIDNGKLVACKYIKITCTSVDLLIYRDYYSVDSYTVVNFYISKKGKLPAFIRNTLINFYNDKNKLKNVKGMEDVYQNKKEVVNSSYGMMVSDILQSELFLNIDTMEIEEKLDFEKGLKLKTVQQSKSVFTVYQWGVFIIAWSRYNLVKNVIEPAINAGGIVVYSDTDSGKIMNLNINPYLEINKIIENRVFTELKKINIPIDYGKGLGIVCKENNKKLKFKTWGAKRYLCRGDNEQHFTISGLSKKLALKYLREQKIDAFEYFKKDMFFPCGYSGRTAAYYDETICDMTIIDYQGNKWVGEVGTGVVVEETEYTMTLLPLYEKYLQDVRKRKD